jgi:hypothetical protein
MVDQLSATVTRGNKRVLIALGILGLLVVAALAGGWAYLSFSGHDRAGLEGTWRFKNNPRHSYEFQANGNLACWYGPKQWWSRIGWSATWRRDGNRITIRTDRNWDFEGQLDGPTIRGRMLMRDQTGAVVTTAEVIWQKE